MRTNAAQRHSSRVNPPDKVSSRVNPSDKVHSTDHKVSTIPVCNVNHLDMEITNVGTITTNNPTADDGQREINAHTM